MKEASFSYKFDLGNISCVVDKFVSSSRGSSKIIHESDVIEMHYVPHP